MKCKYCAYNVIFACLIRYTELQLSCHYCSAYRRSQSSPGYYRYTVDLGPDGWFSLRTPVGIVQDRRRYFESPRWSCHPDSVSWWCYCMILQTTYLWFPDIFSDLSLFSYKVLTVVYQGRRQPVREGCW